MKAQPGELMELFICMPLILRPVSPKQPHKPQIDLPLKEPIYWHQVL